MAGSTLAITDVSSIFYCDGLYYFGTATGGGANYLDDTAATFPAGCVGRILYIYGGTGIGQKRFITASAATRLTVQSNWDTNPDATSLYAVSANGEDLWAVLSAKMSRIANQDSALRYCGFYRLDQKIVFGNSLATFFAGLRECWWIYDYYKVKNGSVLQWGMLKRADAFDTPHLGCHVIVDRLTNPDSFSFCYHVENGGTEHLFDSHLTADKQWDDQAGSEYKVIYSTVNGEVRGDTSYFRHWGNTEFDHARNHHDRNCNCPNPPVIGDYGLMIYANQNNLQCRDLTGWGGNIITHSSGAYDVLTLMSGKFHVIYVPGMPEIDYTKCSVAVGTEMFFHAKIQMRLKKNGVAQSGWTVSLQDQYGNEHLQSHSGGEYLTASMTSIQTTAQVNSTANWVGGEDIFIKNEWMNIVSVDSGVQVTVTRAQYYSTAETHEINETIGTAGTIVSDVNGEVECGWTDQLDSIMFRRNNGSGQPPTWRLFSPFTLKCTKAGELDCEYPVVIDGAIPPLLHVEVGQSGACQVIGGGHIISVVGSA